MRRLLIPMILIALLIGCNSQDERLVRLSQEHEQRQAEQNLRMAELQKQVAEGSRKLVEADAEARKDLTVMQDNLRADQAVVGQQRDQLEADRKEIAAQRNRDPILAASIVQFGLILASLLPLLLAGYLIWSMTHSTSQDDAIVAEFLVNDLAAERPLLSAPSPATRPLLPEADDSPSEPKQP